MRPSCLGVLKRIHHGIGQLDHYSSLTFELEVLQNEIEPLVTVKGAFWSPHLQTNGCGKDLLPVLLCVVTTR
jgi:hypothetical protein